MRIPRCGGSVSAVSIFVGAVLATNDIVKSAEGDVPSISALTAQGFEVKAAFRGSNWVVLVLQKGKDVFECNFGAGQSGCFPVK